MSKSKIKIDFDKLIDNLNNANELKKKENKQILQALSLFEGNNCLSSSNIGIFTDEVFKKIEELIDIAQSFNINITDDNYTVLEEAGKANELYKCILNVKNDIIPETILLF